MNTVMKQLLNEPGQDMKNYADRRECYPPRPKLRAIFKIFGQYNTRKRELKQWKGGSRCIFYHSKNLRPFPENIWY